jgi:MGT family glycosyltransferase
MPAEVRHVTRPGRFLLATVDGGGNAPPALGIAAELVRRGHAVTVLADPTLEASARAAGCAFRAWRAGPCIGSVAEQTELARRVEDGSLRDRIEVGRTFLVDGTPGWARDVAAAASRCGADAVLAEAALPGILLGAVVSGRPAAALMANVNMRPTPGVPLMGTGWSPARGPAGRLRDAVAPRLAQRATALLRPRLNAVLADAGLPSVRHLFELLDRCAEVLVLTSPSFDLPAPRLPANVRYVGPQLDDPDWAATGGDWRPEGSGPLVLVGTSSVQQHGTADLLGRVTAALGQLPVRAVVTTGRAIDPAEVPAAPGVRVVRAAPHAAVLAEAAAVVTHAGHGTTIKALAAGVPLVCVPLGRDQKDNTVRVLRLGAGVRVPKTAPSDRIAAAVREVLDDPRYREAARRFAATLAEEARTRPSAADRAEALLSG